MTRHRIAQIPKTGIPNRQKTDLGPAVSCKIDYFKSAAWPPCSKTSALLHGRLKKRPIKRLKELETENTRLRRPVGPDDGQAVILQSCRRSPGENLSSNQN